MDNKIKASTIISLRKLTWTEFSEFWTFLKFSNRAVIVDTNIYRNKKWFPKVEALFTENNGTDLHPHIKELIVNEIYSELLEKFQNYEGDFHLVHIGELLGLKEQSGENKIRCK